MFYNVVRMILHIRKALVLKLNYESAVHNYVLLFVTLVGV